MASTSVEKTKTEDDGSQSFLLFVTGPVLKFLANKHAGDSPEMQINPQEFWPFAVAGVSLLGVGVWGGYAFMSGDVPAENPGAATEPGTAPEPERKQAGGKMRRRTAVVEAEKAASESAAEGASRAAATRAKAAEAVGQAVSAAEAQALANRAGAVKAASASLALGTLLACTGALVLVQTTKWYLGVKTTQEFAEAMRGMLPARMRGVNESIKLTERKEGVTGWFQSTSVGQFVKEQEDKQQHALRLKEAEVSFKKGILTEREMLEEKERIGEYKPVSSA